MNRIRGPDRIGPKLFAIYERKIKPWGWFLYDPCATVQWIIADWCCTFKEENHMFRKIISGLAFFGVLATSSGVYGADAHPVNSSAMQNAQPAGKLQHAPHSAGQVAPQSVKAGHQGQAAAASHQPSEKAASGVHAAGVKK